MADISVSAPRKPYRSISMCIVQLQILGGIFVCGEIVQMHAIHKSNYAVIKQYGKKTIKWNR